MQAAAGSLKVFPLPDAVLFPNAALPLHVFEPRYRQMVKDALEGDRVLAVAQLKPGWEPHYHGRPALEPIACAGVLVWHESLPDGRFNVVVHGVTRVRLVEELPAPTLYRQVRSEPVPDPPYDGPEEELLRQALFELASRVPAAFAEPVLQLAARCQGGALADVVAATVVADVDRRKELLYELSPGRRLEKVLVELSEVIARLGAASNGGPVN